MSSFSVEVRLIAFKPMKFPTTALARNSAWMILGQGLRLIIQALYFVEIARSLGVRNYGAFIGVVALVGIVYPFGSLGSGNLLGQKRSTRSIAFSILLGTCTRDYSRPSASS